MANAVAKAKSAALSTDVMDDMFADGGEGTAFDASELMIPYVRLAQQMSPQINKKDAQVSLRVLSSGDMFNTLTNAVYDGEDGLNVVPCLRHNQVCKEFVTRENGGGFVQELDASDPVIAQTTQGRHYGHASQRQPTG